MRIVEDPRLSDQRVTEWFLREKARREREKEESRPPAPPSPIPVITLSRQFGAGGHTVALKLVEVLGPRWQIWDKEIIEALARAAKLRTEMVETLDEHTQSWIEQMSRNLFNLRVMEPLAYRRHLTQVLLAVAQQGYKIIVGRGANFVLKDALNVRLRASEEFRIQLVMKRENVSHEEAARQIHLVDRDRSVFTRTVFAHDIDDPAAYDMTLMTDTLGFDASAAAIAAAARSMFRELKS